jgi:hypothetical protein
LITFVLLGRFLEHKAKGKASEAISKLLKLQPDDCVLILAGKNRSILVSEEQTKEQTNSNQTNANEENSAQQTNTATKIKQEEMMKEKAIVWTLIRENFPSKRIK